MWSQTLRDQTPLFFGKNQVTNLPPTISYSIQLSQLKDQSGHEESYLREAEDSDSLTSRKKATNP